MSLGKLIKKSKIKKVLKFGFIFLGVNFLFSALLFIEINHKDLCQMNISQFKKYLTNFENLILIIYDRFLRNDVFQTCFLSPSMNHTFKNIIHNYLNLSHRLHIQYNKGLYLCQPLYENKYFSIMIICYHVSRTMSSTICIFL